MNLGTRISLITAATAVALLAGCRNGKAIGTDDAVDPAGKPTTSMKQTSAKKTSTKPKPTAKSGWSPTLAAAHAQPGFAVYELDGRLWVFRDSSDEHQQFLTEGEPAKRITLVGEGPGGRTVVSADRETIDAYLAGHRYGRPGFAVIPQDGRLWVFRESSKDLAAFRESGEPAKRVTLVGAGPDGKTLMGADKESLDDYAASVRYSGNGFEVFGADGRLWVFRSGSASLHDFLASGEPAKRVTLIGAGPNGTTLMGPDRATLDDYLAAATRQ